MSYCKIDEGKDSVIFITKEDQEKLQMEDIQPDNGDIRQAIGPDGEIDWECPCIKPMTEGPCGLEFKEAFSCFVKSKEEVKGSDCIEAFKAMQSCMAEHPEEYGGNSNATEEEGNEQEDNGESIDQLLKEDTAAETTSKSNDDNSSNNNVKSN